MSEPFMDSDEKEQSVIIKNGVQYKQSKNNLLLS